MRKFTIQLFTLLCALFTCQSITAQEVLFEESFKSSLGEFKEENAGGESSLWQWFFITKSAYITTDNIAMDSRLVSPEFTLLTENVAKFIYRAGDLKDFASSIKFSVREVGGEWVDIKVSPVLNDYSWVAAELAIPTEFDNKKVQVAFHFNADMGTLCVKDLVIEGKKGDAPVGKKDPELSFPETEYTYVFGPDEFEAPVLSNPNSVKVEYSSVNPEVATVDAETGAVTIIAAGVTTIKAVSAETEEYKAGEASYVLTVKETEGPVSGVLFEESFKSSLGEFTEENAGGESSLWQWFFVTKSAYITTDNIALDSRLVSPEFALLTENVAKFIYRAGDLKDFASSIKFSVREVGGEWVDIKVSPVLNDYSWVAVELAIPSEFDNKKVQVAFRFNADMGTLCVKDLVIEGKKGAAPAEKKDPELSFPETEYTYVFGPDKFEAPVLSNPYNVEVTYSTSDINVADVMPYDGEVSVYDYGTVVITATSEETKEYKAGSASYTLNVTDVPTGIDSITAEDLYNGKVYDLMGRKVSKLGKGVFIVNGKKVVIK